MLAFNRWLPEDARDGLPVLVLLHGRGSHRGDLLALRPHLPAGWGLVTPQGPHPGHPWGYGPGWAWYRYIADDRVDGPSLEQSLGELSAFVEELPTHLGVKPGRIAIGGFSQGGTMGLAWALRNGHDVPVLNFSGFLIDSPVVPTDAATVSQTRVFWGHGRRDPAIPFELAERGRARLREGGATLDARDYEIGHWIAPEEIADAMAALTGWAAR
jgi:phospholipase/carboxylesterase